MDLNWYLNQTDVWVSRKGLMKINEMEPVHKAHSARWLYGRSHLLLTLIETAMHEGICVEETEDPSRLHPLLGMLNKNPRHWIRETPLFKELTKGVDPNGLATIELSPMYAQETEF